MESYFVAGSSKEATKTNVPSWSGRRNFNKSETSVEEHLVRCGLMVVHVFACRSCKENYKRNNLTAHLLPTCQRSLYPAAGLSPLYGGQPKQAQQVKGLIMSLFSLEDVWAILTIDQSYVQSSPNVVLHTAQQPVESDRQQKINCNLTYNFRGSCHKSGFLVCEVGTQGFSFHLAVKLQNRSLLNKKGLWLVATVTDTVKRTLSRFYSTAFFHFLTVKLFRDGTW